jgi:mannosyl-oligosaccharide alpha-1,2-mannosidase
VACFAGGNLILGGLVQNEQYYIPEGRRLVDGCFATYKATVTGLGPETFAWQDFESKTTTPPPSWEEANALEFYQRHGYRISGMNKLRLWPGMNATDSHKNPSPPSSQEDFFDKNGFYLNGGNSWQLRPELIESIYYAYRATGSPVYQDWAWDIFQSIEKYARTSSGYAMLSDVNAEGGGELIDDQESYFFAETLKYLYLTFAEGAPWQVKADYTNEFVFNTEGHPLRLANGKQERRRD